MTSRVRLLVVVLFAAAIVATVVLAASASGMGKQATKGAPTPNLVVNGDAESSAGGDDTTVVAAPGWTSTGTLTVVDYALGESKFGPGELPGPTSPGPSDRGENFFSGGPGSPSSSAFQTINLAPYTKMIMDGASFTLSGWLGGYESQDDSVILSTTFKDERGATLATKSIGPVLASDRGGISSLVHREAAGTVPSDAKWAIVIVTMTRATDPGNVFNDGYADNLALTLSPQ